MVSLKKDIVYVGVPLWGYSIVENIMPYEAISIEAFGAIDYSIWDY